MTQISKSDRTRYFSSRELAELEVTVDMDCGGSEVSSSYFANRLESNVRATEHKQTNKFVDYNAMHELL